MNGDLETRSDRVRRRILDTAFIANKGHIGSALSICEVITAVLGATRGLGSDDTSRDRVVLSKGHAALALYAALAEYGVLPESDLGTYCTTNSLLQTHPDVEMAGVDFITGSLGQGIGFGVGVALAESIHPHGVRTRVVLSDSELNEGSTWEAAAIAGTRGLGSLCVVLDQNGQQAMGRAADVMRVGSPEMIWPELGWKVTVVDGHNAIEIAQAIADESSRPHLIVAKTVAGKGVAFMERKIEWHYMPMTQSQYQDALDGLAAQ